ncbi:histone-lysine N-methyltransferase SETMAR [Elysia marginata]|uniref:Histone-lysine N-methyltransferase SETMAR n=1 Tax=Elysia marginata TaxID=1093978 RepID=A0AAV4HRA1_9GAST|nr:histone-lysine N-methyltransferase SETMAR [Elysia marginata]
MFSISAIKALNPQTYMKTPELKTTKAKKYISNPNEILQTVANHFRNKFKDKSNKDIPPFQGTPRALRRPVSKDKLPPIKDWSKLEVRAVVRFVLCSKGIRPEIHKQIAETYGEGAVTRSLVYQWFTWFGEGRTSLDDEPNSGCPKTSINGENTTLVDELVKCDMKMKIREIALKL